VVELATEGAGGLPGQVLSEETDDETGSKAQAGKEIGAA